MNTFRLFLAIVHSMTIRMVVSGVENASIDREIWTNKGDLARVTKYGNILMVLLGIATMNNLE